MFKNNPPLPRFAVLRTSPDDIPVSAHAAFDLRDMDEMRRNGVPISVQAHASEYYDGSPDAGFDFPLDIQRGVDINDVWNHSKDIGKKTKNLKLKFNNNTAQTS